LTRLSRRIVALGDDDLCCCDCSSLPNDRTHSKNLSNWSIGIRSFNLSWVGENTNARARTCHRFSDWLTTV
jgi:hypothetical protein